MRLEKRDVKALRKFMRLDGATIALRFVGIVALAGLTLREGVSGFLLGLLVYVLLQGLRPKLPGRLARLAEAEALPDDPRYRYMRESYGERRWHDD